MLYFFIFLIIKQNPDSFFGPLILVQDLIFLMV